jgi:multidrug efflux pump subunit AcrA (membrane-fusion protein)
MLKRFLPYSLAVLLILAVALAGCGGGKSSEYTLTVTVAGNGTVEPAGGRYPPGPW